MCARAQKRRRPSGAYYIELNETSTGINTGQRGSVVLRNRSRLDEFDAGEAFFFRRRVVPGSAMGV